MPFMHIGASGDHSVFPSPNTRKIVFITFFSSLYLYNHVGTLYLQARGLNLLQAGSLWSIIVATIFVAEVASTMNERLLMEHLLKQTTDPKERFLLLQHAVDQIVGTFYTQVLFADFELQAHRLVERGEPVTTEVLGSLYLGLLRDWYGDAVEIDDFYQWTWARIPHFFGSPYYVYQYATCFASSARLFRTMTTGDEAARRDATARYLALLASGGNDHPMAQLQKAGVDLTRPETVQAVIDEMDALVARMEDEAARLP